MVAIPLKLFLKNNFSCFSFLFISQRLHVVTFRVTNLFTNSQFYNLKSQLPGHHLVFFTITLFYLFAAGPRVVPTDTFVKIRKKYLLVPVECRLDFRPLSALGLAPCCMDQPVHHFRSLEQTQLACPATPYSSTKYQLNHCLPCDIIFL